MDDCSGPHSLTDMLGCDDHASQSAWRCSSEVVMSGCGAAAAADADRCGVAANTQPEGCSEPPVVADDGGGGASTQRQEKVEVHDG